MIVKVLTSFFCEISNLCNEFSYFFESSGSGSAEPTYLYIILIKLRMFSSFAYATTRADYADWGVEEFKFNGGVFGLAF